MLNKLFALAVRGVVTFGIGVGLGFTLYKGFDSGKHIAEFSMLGIWLLGGIYSLVKFNQPFNINALEKADDKIHNIIDVQSKKKIEDDMLRVKKLLDSGILTQEEYEHKIKGLKNKYFSFPH